MEGIPEQLAEKSSTPSSVGSDLYTPAPRRNLHETTTPTSQPRLESPSLTSSSSGDSTAPGTPSATQMSDQGFSYFPRRSPRSATQIPPSADASRHSSASTEPAVHSYSPYPNYYPHYSPSNIDPSHATSPPTFGYPQFYQQGSHSPDPGLVPAGHGRSNYQQLAHQQSHYGSSTYSSDGSGGFHSSVARSSPMSSHPFTSPPSASNLASSSGGSSIQQRSSPAMFSGTSPYSSVPHFPPHMMQGNQYSYSPQSYSSSPHHQMYAPSHPQYHATPAENEHGQLGWWYPAPTGMSMASQYETSSRMAFQGHPQQYTLPFNPPDQRYQQGGPHPGATSGGRSIQGTPRRETINITNPSSASTAAAPPILQRSDSAPTSPTHSQGSNNSIPRRAVQGPASSHSAAPGRPHTPSDKGPTRRSYHPNPPASRSEWVMWVGNVPPDATEDELWKFFSSPSPTEKEHPSALKPPSTPAQPALSPGTSSLAPPPLSNPSSSRSSPSSGSRPSTATPYASSPASQSTTGIVSIFLISRSSCAFVNYEDEPRLRNAIARFNGKVLRPNDPKCPKLVCRERKKEDDLKAGVGAQRGTGMHSKWLKEQKVKIASPAPLPSEEPTERPSPKPLHELSGAESTEDEGGSKPGNRSKQRRMSMSSSSGSFTSTTSSMLARYFPKRYFILKSLTQYDVDLSVKEGLWATQKHNEGVLDQAYRTSQDVYLIFSVNKSGEFYGYARMAGPIRGGDHSVSWASRTPSSSRSSLNPPKSGSAKGSDSSPEIGNILAPPSAASAPLPSGSHDEQVEAARSMPELGSHKTPGNNQLFLSPRDNKVIAESPRSLDSEEEEGEGPPLPTIREESSSPGSTPPSEQETGRHTYPPSSLPRSREDGGHPVRHSLSAPPEFAVTNRVLGPHTSFGSRSEEHLDPSDFAAPPIVELDPEAPVRARRSPPESPDQPQDKSPADIVVKEEEDDDAALDNLRRVETKPVDQATEVGTRTDPLKEESWGEPFKIEWLCLQRLSFQRTRQIRNPWNHDREVKVSRDGTELEPVVGQKLLDEFAKLVEEQKQGQSEDGTNRTNITNSRDGAALGGESQ